MDPFIWVRVEMAETKSDTPTVKAEVGEDDLEVKLAEDLDDSPDAGEVTALGMPDEEQESIIQLTELAEKTVKPGLMRLDVVEVADAKNSPQAVIGVEHPVEGTIHFQFAKMSDRKTWDEGSELKRILDWYGYTKRNMHALKTDRLYVRYNPSGDGQSRNNEWDVVAPPSEIKQKVKRYKDAARSSVRRKMPPTAIRVGLALSSLKRSLKRRYRWAIPTGSHTALGGLVSFFILTSVFLMTQILALMGLVQFGMVVAAMVASALVGAAVGIITLPPPEHR